jgi:hypothetical protein
LNLFGTITSFSSLVGVLPANRKLSYHLGNSPERANLVWKDQYWEVQVLVLYRKREGARRLPERDVFVRFRYNDLKEAGRDCGGRDRYANSIV